MRWTVLLIAVILFAPGCFVFEELDKGQAIMEQHSPKKKAEKEAPPPTLPVRKKPEDEGLLASVQSWWKEHKRAAEAASRPQRDPDDVPVRCRSGGNTQYLRKSDCLVRGGTVL
jgi:hypothetical protein